MKKQAVDNVVLAHYIDPLPAYLGNIRLAPISEQADIAEEVGTETLYFCPDPWALRHRFINPQTGEVVRARCDRWNCLYCGPRKTDQWRQLIAAAEPVSHVVLSRAGHTVEESARALTTFIQYLRRGSKGRGKGHIGVRPAYPLEYFAVLERHRNFEESGFHWHLLVKGVDFIEKEHLDSAWASATHGRNDFAFIQRVTNPRAIGYVTKYLTKDITRVEKGMKERLHEVSELTGERRHELSAFSDELGGDETEGGEIGQLQFEVREVEVRKARKVKLEVVSQARRIRYSRHFFPESTEELRFRLFSKLDDPENSERDLEPVEGTEGEESTALDEFEQATQEQAEKPQRARWQLYEAEPFTRDIEEYRARRRRALLESLMVVRAGQWRMSGRVLSVWAYQRGQKYQRDDREAIVA